VHCLYVCCFCEGRRYRERGQSAHVHAEISINNSSVVLSTELRVARTFYVGRLALILIGFYLAVWLDI